MGLLAIVLGLALMGVLADILIENDIATAAEQSFLAAGTTQRLSMPVLVAIAFAMGAVAVGLILAGIRSLRRGRRRMLKQRIRVLEDENARLHTQRNLQQIVHIPEAEREWAPDTATTAPPDTATTAPPDTVAASPEQSSDEPASKW